jgi:hypothetical protein
MSEMCVERRFAAIAYVVLIVMGLRVLTGCASSGDSGYGPSGLSIVGDENGGTIPRSVGAAATQSPAYEMINAHCAKFGKKGFITRMDFEGGTMTFQCVVQKAKPSS